MLTPRNQILKTIEYTNGFEQIEQLPEEELFRQYFVCNFRKKSLKSAKINVNLQKIK